VAAVKTLQQRLADAGIRMTATPCGKEAQWGIEYDKWRCTLQRVTDEGKRRYFTVVFRQGPGWDGAKPVLVDVVECLLSDAHGVTNAETFTDWAGEFGYDTDSRSAEAVYLACLGRTTRLAAFLPDDINQWLYETVTV
jgi:hypothetical protein